MALESEGGESVENSIENLNLEDLTVQKEKKEKELNDLETTLNKAKKALEDKQTKEAKKPLDDYVNKKLEWENLDTLAKGMNKELKEAIAAFEIAEDNFDSANAIAKELDDLNLRLATANNKLAIIAGANNRKPQEELDGLNTNCKEVEAKTMTKLKREEDTANRTLALMQDKYDKQLEKVKNCQPSECQGMQTNLEKLKEKKLNPAVLALATASAAIVLLEDCTAKRAELSTAMEILANPDKAREDADKEINVVNDLIKDPKFVNAEDNKKKADDEYTRKAAAKKDAADKAPHKPDAVEEAQEKADQAELDLGDLEPAKTTYEGELAKLKKDVEDQQKEFDEKKAEVAKLTDLYDAKKQEKGGEPGTGNVGMMAGAIVGVVVVVAVIAAVVVTKKKKMFCFADKGDAKKRCITYKETDNADGASGKQSEGTGSQQGSNKAPKKRPGIGAPGSNQE